MAGAGLPTPTPQGSRAVTLGTLTLGPVIGAETKMRPLPGQWGSSCPRPPSVPRGEG